MRSHDPKREQQTIKKKKKSLALRLASVFQPSSTTYEPDDLKQVIACETSDPPLKMDIKKSGCLSLSGIKLNNAEIPEICSFSHKKHQASFTSLGSITCWIPQWGRTVPPPRPQPCQYMRFILALLISLEGTHFLSSGYHKTVQLLRLPLLHFLYTFGQVLFRISSFKSQRVQDSLSSYHRKHPLSPGLQDTQIYQKGSTPFVKMDGHVQSTIFEFRTKELKTDS